LAFLLASCTLFTPAPVTTVQKTPLEKAKDMGLYFNQTYNAQSRDTMEMATLPNPTQAQEEMVITKKAILPQVWPLIKSYDAIVKNGGIPTIDDEQKISNLINQLVTQVAK
jgi:hypothetical protein